ncbi:peptidoglycan-binding domain-containing protein [Bacillus sp. Bva_UNVM-123]|uniref:peptidoglycan-binding domain-containing protein n=1 Tax=Bacillus sp. Bva_UNVM-123 TaxID=2829798 RepID=UPI00391F6048
MNAVIAFQQENNLEATGDIDQRTASALEQAVLNVIKKEENDIQLQTAIHIR